MRTTEFHDLGLWPVWHKRKLAKYEAQTHVFSCCCPTIDVLLQVVTCYYCDYDFETVMNCNVKLGVKGNLFFSTWFFSGYIKRNTNENRTYSNTQLLHFPFFSELELQNCSCLLVFRKLTQGIIEPTIALLECCHF